MARKAPPKAFSRGSGRAKTVPGPTGPNPVGKGRALRAKGTPLSYTPSPAVKSNSPGRRGGVWHNSTGKSLGFSKSEDSPIRRGTGRASTKSTRPR